MDASALLRFADGGIHFLLSAVLAGAAVFGDYAPFGVALVGAAGSGVCGAAALVGACFGYLTLLGFTGGLRYISASMLTFAVNFAFYDVKLLRGVTGFIYLSEAGWRTEDVIYFFTECFLTAAASWCYRQLLLPLRTGRGEGILSPQRRVSLAALACTVLMSLSSLTLFEDVSLGPCLRTSPWGVPWRWWWSSPPPGRGEPPPGRCWGCRWGCPWTWRPTGSRCTPWPTACPAWRRGPFG